MSSDRFTLGIDIGGTNLRMGLINEGGKVTAYEKRSSAEITGEGAVEKLGDAIEAYISQTGCVGSVAAICIGFPATVDKTRTTVLNAPNLKGFDGIPVGPLLSERLSTPVYIEKDVNLLLVSDLDALGCKADDVCACYIGTGIGNAIMIGGRLVTGANGVAGELGHTPFGDSTNLCGCGNYGCAEAISGGVFLTGLKDSMFPDTDISELFVWHGNAPVLTEYTERLARVIAAEVNIIDPEILLLGGGVVEMMGFPKDKLEEAILAHIRKPLPHDNLKIVYSPAGDGTNGVIGAGILAWRNVR